MNYILEINTNFDQLYLPLINLSFIFILINDLLGLIPYVISQLITVFSWSIIVLFSLVVLIYKFTTILNIIFISLVGLAFTGLALYLLIWTIIVLNIHFSDSNVDNFGINEGESNDSDRQETEQESSGSEEPEGEEETEGSERASDSGFESVASEDANRTIVLDDNCGCDHIPGCDSSNCYHDEFTTIEESDNLNCCKCTDTSSKANRGCEDCSCTFHDKCI